MPVIYLTFWDNADNEVIAPLVYGKNGKRRRRPEPLKPTPWQRLKSGVCEGIWLFCVRPEQNRRITDKRR